MVSIFLFLGNHIFRIFFTSIIIKTSSFNSYQLSFLFSIEIHYEILMDHRFWSYLDGSFTVWHGNFNAANLF